MSYQKCPVCNGTGEEINAYSTGKYLPCSVCKGAKIINTATGEPPESVGHKTNAVSTENCKINIEESK